MQNLQKNLNRFLKVIEIAATIMTKRIFLPLKWSPKPEILLRPHRYRKLIKVQGNNVQVKNCYSNVFEGKRRHNRMSPKKIKNEMALK